MRNVEPALSHLFIVQPFAGGMASLFSTHPPVQERIRRLRGNKNTTNKKSGRGAPHPLPQVAGALRLRFPRLRSGQAGQATGLGVTMGSGEEARLSQAQARDRDSSSAFLPYLAL
jgi:hypothetical protein